MKQQLDKCPHPSNNPRVSSYSIKFSFCSIGESCSGLGAPLVMGESIMEEHLESGVFAAAVSLETTNDGLCGNGDISITSIGGAGDEEGSGGVVMASSK